VFRLWAKVHAVMATWERRLPIWTAVEFRTTVCSRCID